MKLSDLSEARFAKQTYPDDELIRLLDEPIRGNHYQDRMLIGQLSNYFMDEDKELRWRLKALAKYDRTLGHQEKVYTQEVLDDAVQQMRDNAEPQIYR